MKPLVVLIVSFGLSLLIIKMINGAWDYILAGNIGMCVMLLFTALGHFLYRKGMKMMMPEFIPFKITMIYFTGVLEVVAGLALLLPHLRYATGCILIMLFIVLLPCNIYAAERRINYQKADHTGPGPSYLWLRVPLQLFFIVWVYYFSVR
jgi:uncharacterized membrane protein